LHTNIDLRAPRVYEYSGLTIRKGDYIGSFRMGSSVLLVAATREPAPPALGISTVQFGDPLTWPPGK